VVVERSSGGITRRIAVFGVKTSSRGISARTLARLKGSSLMEQFLDQTTNYHGIFSFKSGTAATSSASMKHSIWHMNPPGAHLQVRGILHAVAD
jgi:hypothetical protein